MHTDLDNTGRVVDEPLGTDSQLDEDSEEEKQRLVRSGQVDTAVEWDQEHTLDKERAEDEGVGETGAETHSGTGQHGGFSAEQSWHSRAQEQT